VEDGADWAEGVEDRRGGTTTGAFSSFSSFSSIAACMEEGSARFDDDERAVWRELEGEGRFLWAGRLIVAPGSVEAAVVRAAVRDKAQRRRKLGEGQRERAERGEADGVARETARVWNHTRSEDVHSAAGGEEDGELRM
jgi:hypothetical protein